MRIMIIVLFVSVLLSIPTFVFSSEDDKKEIKILQEAAQALQGSNPELAGKLFAMANQEINKVEDRDNDEKDNDEKENEENDKSLHQ